MCEIRFLAGDTSVASALIQSRLRLTACVNFNPIAPGSVLNSLPVYIKTTSSGNMHQVFISCEHGTQTTVVWRLSWSAARTHQNAGAKTPANLQSRDQSAFTTTSMTVQVYRQTAMVMIRGLIAHLPALLAPLSLPTSLPVATPLSGRRTSTNEQPPLVRA